MIEGKQLSQLNAEGEKNSKTSCNHALGKHLIWGRINPAAFFLFSLRWQNAEGHRISEIEGASFLRR